MTQTIAFAGKGGVGKTTICGMLIQYLCRKNDGAVLAVDADANSNLNEVLGVEVETTLGSIREEMAQAELHGSVPAGMTKQDYAEMKFSDALVEEKDFDMLVMGRTQGKGCYCYVNGVLKAQVDKYVNNYRYMVIDNEARLLPPGHPGCGPHRRDGGRAGAEAQHHEAYRQSRPRRRPQRRGPRGD